MLLISMQPLGEILMENMCCWLGLGLGLSVQLTEPFSRYSWKLIALLDFHFLSLPRCCNYTESMGGFRMSTDEDGEAEAKHLHHTLLTVDHCY